MKVVIVEDEKPILELMKVVIGRNPSYTIAGAFTNPLEALVRLPELRPDVAFLDVEMPKMNGIELGKKINELSMNTQIVFTTAYKEYAVEAFGVQALDYILKPVTPAAIERVSARLGSLKRNNVAAADEKDRGASVIHCFGSFELRGPEGSLIRFRTRKMEEMLAYFLCHANRKIQKGQLMDLFWPDSSEERASHSLHQSIYQIKKMLKEQAIDMDVQKANDGYVLETRGETFDLLEYKRLDSVNTERWTDYEEAERLCSLYRGPLLDGKSYLWKVPYEEAFQKHFTALTRSLVERDLSAANWVGAENRLDSYLALYPLNEEMNRILIELYGKRGFKEKLARHYSSFKDAYRRELGLELSQELRALATSYLG